MKNDLFLRLCLLCGVDANTETAKKAKKAFYKDIKSHKEPMQAINAIMCLIQADTPQNTIKEIFALYDDIINFVYTF